MADTVTKVYSVPSMEPQTPHQTDHGTMLSVDFPTPAARVERLKRMAVKHPAFDKSRHTQEILVRAQHALRRMPGVSGQDANELVSSLQEVGQMINQETTQLVDALMNLTLDQEESEQAMARMSIDANLAQAKNQDQAQTIIKLRTEAKVEQDKREEAEVGVRTALEKVEALEGELKMLKQDGNGQKTKADDLVQVGESASRQGSPRRQWPLVRREPDTTPSRDSETAFTSRPVRVASAFQNMGRTPVGPPKFGPLPPRAPAYERRFQTSIPWGRSMSTGAGGGAGAGAGGGLMQQQHQQQQQQQQAAGSRFQPLPRYRSTTDNAHHHHHHHHNNNHHHQPAPFQQQYNNHDMTRARREYYYPTTPPSHGRFPDTTPIQITDRAIAAWSDSMADLYHAIRHFVTRHASEPDCGGGALVGAASSLWPVLLAVYHPLSENEAASYLDFHLRSESSKACVVTRVIVDYVVNRVWVPGAWTGSDSKTTYDLLELEREMDATQAYHRHKTDEITRQLNTTLQPLLNRYINHVEARRDLDRVAELAWDVSSKMLASRLTFDFRFPDIGARFSSQSMLPIWPHLDPVELQAKHWRVAFVTTPVITCRNDTGGGISAHSVALADVFCMQ
ncbi:hypothetical protein CDD80_2062 [Ophiocordyceps camponoti-rufipedis]|uniref:Uncharacterized protein n=1 Tax=Ophiocordyceps camponoti-rufipedis TaxID=2004952 RepID=A0A2C5XKW7_9HYPO|nr:hypothetical protein CDD80_2062 [Ophiocordyceps camponoti-rufipedis]